jgi:hypothetical protein
MNLKNVSRIAKGGHLNIAQRPCFAKARHHIAVMISHFPNIRYAQVVGENGPVFDKITVY